MAERVVVPERPKIWSGFFRAWVQDVSLVGEEGQDLGLVAGIEDVPRRRARQ